MGNTSEFGKFFADGIFATAKIPAGGLIFRGEGRQHRLVTKRLVATWSDEDKLLFRRYAYPLSDEVYVMWADDPTQWAPQNHSCEANTIFAGLDVVASRPIAAGEELTLDYAVFMNEASEPFACTCGTPSCRGIVTGTPGNSVTTREQALSS